MSTQSGVSSKSGFRKNSMDYLIAFATAAMAAVYAVIIGRCSAKDISDQAQENEFGKTNSGVYTVR